MTPTSSLRRIPPRAEPPPYTSERLNNDTVWQWSLPPQTELLILWSVRGAGNEGIYGLDIQRSFSECSQGNEEISIGSLYSTLKRLRKKGLVDSRQGDPVGGGAHRQYYFLTVQGRETLNAVDQFIAALQTRGSQSA